MNIQTIQQFLRARWQRLAVYGGLFGGLAVLQFVLLGSLLNGFSAHELQAYHTAGSLRTIWHEPLNAPFSLLAYAFGQLAPHSLFAVRLAAATVGFATLVAFCALVRTWYGMRTAVLSTALFGSSSWFLHTSRLGTASVLLFGVFMLVAAVAWARRTHRPLAWLSCVALGMLLLYVPGAVWFLAIGGLWQIKTFGGLVWQRRWVSLVGGAIALLGVVPLAWALYRSPSLVRSWLGLPAHWSSPLTSLHHILNVPVHVLFRGPGLPEHWLGHLPMLDIFSLIALLFGAYALAKYSRRLAVGFGLFFVIGCVLIGLGGVGLSVLAPFVYLLVAGGVHELLGRWLRVFPRNPIARQLGVGLIALVVVFAASFSIRAYFIAWPQAKVTESVFTYQKP